MGKVFPAAPFQIGIIYGMDLVYRLSPTQRYLLTVERRPTLSADPLPPPPIPMVYRLVPQVNRIREGIAI
jgi:hypothetical protein